MHYDYAHMHVCHGCVFVGAYVGMRVCVCVCVFWEMHACGIVLVAFKGI